MSEPQVPVPSQPQVPCMLPEKISDVWLDQIKSALKTGWWTAILGSSLLATVISSLFSYYVAMKNIEATRQLEQSKSQLELRVEAVRSRADAFKKLAQSLDDLELKLEGFVDLVQIAQTSPRSVKTAGRIQEQLSLISFAARKVVTARRDPVLNGAEIGKAVDECLRELGPAIAAAQNDPWRPLTGFNLGIQQLRQLISRIAVEIPEEIKGIK